MDQTARKYRTLIPIERGSRPEPRPESEPSARRKRDTVPVACIRCRRRKTKCDGSVPTCARCIRYEVECEYAPPELEGRAPDLKRKLLDLGQQLNDVQRSHHELSTVFHALRTRGEAEVAAIVRCIREGQDVESILSELTPQGTPPLKSTPGATRDTAIFIDQSPQPENRSSAQVSVIEPRIDIEMGQTFDTEAGPAFIAEPSPIADLVSIELPVDIDMEQIFDFEPASSAASVSIEPPVDTDIEQLSEAEPTANVEPAYHPESASVVELDIFAEPSSTESPTDIRMRQTSEAGPDNVADPTDLSELAAVAELTMLIVRRSEPNFPHDILN